MRVAIVGAGFSGTIAAIELSRLGAEAVLIDGPGRFAAGIAYSTREPMHLLNVRAKAMSAFADDPAHFLRWVEREGLGTAESFVPRRDYGRYLRGVFDEALLRGGIERVRGIAVELGTQKVLLEEGEPVACDRVILAGGNYPSALPGALGIPAERSVDDPWSPEGAERLRALARQERDILLVGTGLTMIDMCLSLVAEGFTGRIVATSRRGLVPRAHEVEGTDPDRPPLPGPLMPLLRRVRAQAGAGNWRAAVDSLRPVSAEIWRGLTAEEKRRFIRHLRPWWDVHRHRIGPPVAERIERLRADGQLEVFAGRISGVRVTGGTLEVAIALRGGGKSSVAAAGVVNCTGPQGAIARVRDPLVQSLLSSGAARPDALGLGLDVDAQSRVVDAQGNTSDRLFALGPLTRGAFWEIVAVPDIRGQARDVAQLAAY